LLDAAAWLLEAASPGTKLRAADIPVSANFEYHPTEVDLQVEVGVHGDAVLPNEVRLIFDLSYQAPKGSVFELFEVRDRKGNRLRLLRDQPHRSCTPGRVLHQLADGTVVGSGFVERDAVGIFSFVTDNPTAGANNVGPLLQFLQNIAHFDGQTSVQRSSVRTAGHNECDARFVMNTQELIAAIYKCERLR